MNQKELVSKIGQRIKELRESKNISQQDLSALCNFEKSNMSRIESGRTNMTVGSLLKISQALNTSVSYITDVEN